MENVGEALQSLLAVTLVAAVAPLLLGLLPRLRVPQVVLLLAGGIVVGPAVLGWADPTAIEPLADLGLGFVFLLAGYEIDQRLYRQDAGRRALVAWFVSLLLALGVIGLLAWAGLVRAFVPVALAMTTTALGTLVPILRENDMLRGRLGGYLMAGGAAGELLPILAIAVFLGIGNRFVALLSLAAVVVLAVLLGVAARVLRPGGRLDDIISERQHETSQITLRFTVLLLVLLLAVTERFHLDAVLGAFVAGMVLRRWAGRNARVLEEKLDVAGHGFLIPIFFVYSGMTIDVRAIAAAPLRLLLFFGLMILIRGLPALLVYLRVLSLRERVQTVLVTATALPLVVALTQIGLRNGTMLPENGAALVGAAVLTVLVLPTVAVAITRPGPDTGRDVVARRPDEVAG
ncbi:cation:proton antiporter [Pseudonocardia dioxanivorans]|uniref:Sodium/hydrogen exchanger n=1 Tax=Pseudonocardia dioxanivorans (strain ATCC 55486 / DSM 44775 / JCM 13855 / CB1190) TaxID=675635 RepID=F4CX18_PSEUX|nr:cation:proton antiporter [Pseudonocardia dioxanivorans]AEA24649.1 sodium/hydrogen exchanger [Pseudonocardia dioxanivorans CB1190]